MSKTGNYNGWRDRPYERNGKYNGDRLIEHGLVQGVATSAVTATPLTPEKSMPLGRLDLAMNDLEHSPGATIL